MNWPEVNPARGEYRWIDKYDGAADAQVKAGLKVSTVFHCSAAWARADGDIKAFPDDPRDGYAWGRALAEHFKGRISAYEIWNEADISVFGDETADRYAPLLKAAYLGIKAADPGAIVLMNAFALRSKPFGEVLGLNDISAYTDAWNHHLYVPYDEHPVVTRWHQELASKCRMSALPFWVTEAGIRVPDQGGRLGEKDRWTQAEFVAKSYALSLASGIGRHFFFIFPYYLEHGIDFGLLDKDLAPAPGAAAFAAMSYALGAAVPLGEGLHATSPDVAARVFDAGPWRAAVVWRDAGPGIVEVKTADPAPRAIGVTGEEIPIDASGGVVRLAVGPSPVYLVAKDLAPARSGKVEEPVSIPEPPGLKEVIVRINLPHELARYRDSFYAFEPGATAEGSVEAWNLGTAPVKGVMRVWADDPYVAGPAETPVAFPAGGTVKIPITVRAPARGKQKLCRVEARLEDGPVPERRDGSAVPAHGTGQGGVRTSSFARLRVGLDPARIKYPVVEPLLLKPEAWTPGISADGKMTLSAAESGGLRVHSQFSAPGDRWAYPALAFRPPRDFSKFDALRLRLKTIHEAPDMMIRVQVVEPNGAAYLTTDGRRGFAGSTIDWVIPFDGLVHGDFSKPDPNGRLDLDQVDRILVGVNQTGDASSFDLLVLEAVGTGEKTGAAPDSRK